MRSSFAATSISLGAVSLSFSAVVFILAFAGHMVDPSLELGRRIEAGLVSLVLGVVLLGVGVLAGGYGRRSRASARE
jgi:tetrahydromethanopterin S-methyltransferase subunit E